MGRRVGKARAPQLPRLADTIMADERAAVVVRQAAEAKLAAERQDGWRDRALFQAPYDVAAQPAEPAPWTHGHHPGPAVEVRRSPEPPTMGIPG